MGIQSELARQRQNAQEITRLIFEHTQMVADQLLLAPPMRNASLIDSNLLALEKLRLKARRALRAFQSIEKQQDNGQGRQSLKQRIDQKKDKAFFDTLAGCLKKWPHVMYAVQLQIAGLAEPLYPETRNFYDRQTQQTGALDAVFMALHKLANPENQSQAAQELGCHSDIPLFPSVFVADAHAAYRLALAQRHSRPLRFLDIGCGGGIKLLLAAQFFAEVSGLEYDRGYVDQAARVQEKLALKPAEIIHADALEFTGYADFDVLYFYQPMKTGDGLARLEERIAKHARKGTILMAPYPQFASRSKELGCAHVAGHVFLAKTSQQQADNLREHAQTMGFVMAAQIDEPDSPDDFWHPLRKACQANGFGF